MVHEEEKRSYLVFWALLFLIVVSAGILRLLTVDFFFFDFFGHYNFFDPDSYYHLRRLVHFIQNFPNTLNFDPLLSWPNGARVDWPNALLILYGLPSWILGVDSFKELELTVSLLSVLYGLIFLFFIYKASRFYFTSDYQLIALFLAAINPLLIRYSCLGQIDHHLFESMGVVISLWLCLETFKNRRDWAAVSLGLWWAFSFSISSSSLFTVGAVLISAIVVWASRENCGLMLKIFISFILAYIGIALWHKPQWRNSFDLMLPSLFQGLLVSSLVLVYFIHAYVQSRSKKIYFYLGFLILISLCLVFIPAFQRAVLFALGYTFGRFGILQFVIEANPLFSYFGALDFNFAIKNLGFIFPVVFLGPLFLINWKKRSKEERFLLLLFVLLLIPALFQRRFLHFVLPVYFSTAIWLLCRLHAYFLKNGFRLRAITSLAFILLFAFSGLKYDFVPNVSSGHRVDFGLLKILKEEISWDDQEAWKRLGFPSMVKEGIWANPNLGHLLTYVTGYGSVIGAFYKGASLSLDYQLRTAESQDQLRSILQKNRIRWAVLANDFEYFEMLHRIRGEPTDYFVHIKNEARYFDLQQLERFAWVFLILRPDLEFEGAEELVSVQFMEPHFYNFARVFEVPLIDQF